MPNCLRSAALARRQDRGLNLWLRSSRRSGFFSFPGSSGRGSGRASDGLIVARQVESELAEEFAGGGVDDADMQVLDEQPGVI